MKRIFTVIFCLGVVTGYAQNVGVGTNRPLSKLHVAGDLRVDSLATGKDSGLVLHNQQGVLRSLKFTGKKEDVLRGDGSFATLAATGAWDLMGNAGTDPAVNFLGTTDDKPLHFRINRNPWGAIGLPEWNNAIGRGTLQALTTGAANTAFGDAALLRVTIGYNNTAVGASTLTNNVSGRDNTAVGASSLSLNTGYANTGVGAFALRLLRDEFSYNNTALGYWALGNMTLGWGNVAIGANSQINNLRGSDNVSIGVESLYSGTSVSNTVAIGPRTLYSNTSGADNDAIGVHALYRNTTGSGNIAIGTFALAQNTTASQNTAVGHVAMTSNITGKSNTALGYGSMSQNTFGSSNVAIGNYGATRNKTGNDLVAVGDSALLNNSSASYNTAIGQRSLLRTSSGGGNTGVGHLALSFNTTGINNTAVGKSADVASQNLSNATAIGYNAKVDASNKVRIGNAAVTKIEGQVPFTTPSDGRYKYNVQEDVSGLNFVMRLRPVTYQFDVKRFDGLTNETPLADVTQVAYDRAAAVRRTGFIAQEVETAAKEAGYNFSGLSSPENEKEYYSLSYESFVVPLVKAVQEQQLYIARLKKNSDDSSQRMEALESAIEAQQQVINRQQQQIEQLMTELKKLTSAAQNN